MTEEQREQLLTELDGLLENVEMFVSIDVDESGGSDNRDEDSPKRARQIVAELLKGNKATR